MNIQRTATLLLLLAVLLLATEFAAEATHRATEPCVANCSWWNVVCKLGNLLARCSSGH